MNKAIEFLQQQIGKEAKDSPSPLMRWLNPVMLSVEEGKISLQYSVRKEMTNPIGTLHGGATAAIIDDAIGATLFSFGEPYFYSTIHLSIDYYSPALEGELIIAETSIIKKGKQIINAQCEIWNADKTRMIARGYSSLIKTEMIR
jgi:acyl-coenzyme A thioesterase 13